MAINSNHIPSESERMAYEVVPGKTINVQPLYTAISLLNNGKTQKLENANKEELDRLLNKAEVTWIDYSVEDIAKGSRQIAFDLGFSAELINNLLSSQFSGYEDLDVEMGVMLPVSRVENNDINYHRLLVLMKKAIIVTIHEKNVVRFNRLIKYAPAFMQKIPLDDPWNDKLTMILVRIIDDNNEKNFECLRFIEVQGDELGKQLADPKGQRSLLAPGIYKIKHTLISYLDGLWASLDVVSTLRHGDADTITNSEKLLARFELLSDHINRQIALGEHMSEVLASGLEVLQTIFNNQLQAFNNRLAWIAAWLAVVGTGVLVPNTLATIFGIGPISEKFSATTIMVILTLSSVISMIIIYIFIKWKGFIPKEADKVS